MDCAATKNQKITALYFYFLIPTYAQASGCDKEIFPKKFSFPVGKSDKKIVRGRCAGTYSMVLFTVSIVTV